MSAPPATAGRSRLRKAGDLGLGLLLAVLLVPSATAFNVDWSDASGEQLILWCSTSNVRVYDTTGGPYPVPNARAIHSFASLPIPVTASLTTSSTAHDVRVETYSQWNDIASAKTIMNNAGGCFTSAPNPVVIQLNTFWMWDDNADKIQAIMAHEMLHAFGLNHVDSTTALMYSTQAPYENHNIVLPVLDDINGLRYLYATRNSALSLSSQTGGTIVRDGMGKPVRLYVDSATNGRYAYAHEDWYRGSTFQGMVASAYVTPNRAYRFGLHVGTNANIGTAGSSAVNLEFDNDGAKLSFTNTYGNPQYKWLWSGTPTTGQQYFLLLYWKPAQHDASVGDVFTYVYRVSDGAMLDSEWYGGVNLKYGTTTGWYKRGLAVWSESGGAASDYSVATEYFGHRN